MNKFIIRLCSLGAVSLMCLTLVVAQPVTITVLHVNDTHSHLDSFGPKDVNLDGTIGGIAKAATLIGTVKATEPNIVLLHAGDMFHGDLFYNKYFGVPEFQIMQQLGFDAMAVGNHEFEFGPDVLASSLVYAFGQNPPFPLLSANTDVSNCAELQPYIRPATVITRGGVKIGIFGMTIPGHPTENPGPAVISSDVIPIAAHMVAELRQVDGAQVVICLSHLGSLFDNAVASYVPGIDVIVGGHDHYVFDPPVSVTNPEGKTTLILQAGSNYEHVGKLSLTVDNGTVSVAGYQMMNVDASVPKVAEIQAVVDQLKAEIVEQYGDVYQKVVGTAAFDMTQHYDPSSPKRDSPLGNLVADACRQKTHTDIAIVAHGFIGEKIYAGPIVGADIFRPLANGYDVETGKCFKLVTLKLTGMDIITGLEASLSFLGLDDDFFLDVSGMKYRYDASRPVYQRVDIKSIHIEGVGKFNPMATYSVTVNEGIAAMFSFMGVTPTDVQTLPMFEYDVVRDFIAHRGTVEYVAQGRITDNSVKAIAKLGKESAKNDDETETANATKVPAEFQLGQNYPNPFNPATTFSVDIPKESYVSLKVYNLLGQEVATVTNGTLLPGSYQYRFDASRLSTGTYVYQLRAGNVVQTKKMILMK